MILGTVVGVVKDFNTEIHVYANSKGPLVISWARFIPKAILTLRLSSVTPERFDALNSILQKTYPEDYYTFEKLTKTIYESSDSIRSLRDGVLLSSIVVFLIALMGLFGYIDDEVSRRTKEIAIRKINGATASGILRLLYKNMAYISVPAVVLGVSGAIAASTLWLQQFPDKVSINPVIYILCTILLFFIIAVCILYKSWHIANANPVENIKIE